MNLFIPLVLVIVIAVLIFKSIGKSDPAAEACAKEVIQLLRKAPDASPEDIAKIFESHNRTVDEVDQVSVIVKTRLIQTQIRKEKHPEVMARVRKAKELL